MLPGKMWTDTLSIKKKQQQKKTNKTMLSILISADAATALLKNDTDDGQKHLISVSLYSY